jgi:hypothetical protein
VRSDIISSKLTYYPSLIKVKDEANISEAKEPGIGWCTRTVENGITHGLDCLVTVLSVVLVLLVRFALPTANKKGTEDVDNLVADLDLCSIADELGHGSPFSDVFFEGVDELLVCFHSVYIGKEGLDAQEELGTGGQQRVYPSRGIRSNGFITTVDIHGRKRRLVMLLESCTHWDPGVLSKNGRRAP